MKKKTTEKPKYSMPRNIAYVLKLQFAKNKLSLLLPVITIPLGLIISFLDIYLPKMAVSEATSQNSISVIAVRFVCIFAALLICTVLATVIENKRSIESLNFLRYFRKKKMQKCLNTDYENIESQEFRTVMDRSDQILWRSGGVSAVERISSDFCNLISNVLKYFMFSAVLSFASPWLVVYLTLMPVINFFMARHVQKFQFKNREEMSVLDKYLWYIASLCGALDASKDIRIYGLTDWLIGKYRSTMKERMSWNVKVAGKNSLSSFVDVLLILARDSVAYFVLITMVLKGQITVDNFVLYMAAVGSYATMIGGIINTFSDLSGISFLLNDYRECVDFPELKKRDDGDTVRVSRSGCEIRMENVSYKYPTAEENTLKNISFNIKPGENISIVGLNGAGKTTLVKLLCGLYTPTEGKVSIDGRDMMDHDIYKYYSMFSAVFQDFTFLPISIASNVSCKDEDETDIERVIWALKTVGIYDKIMSFENGIYTKLNKQLNEDGIDLSGGEKQKLLIARAIYRDAPILILDEPTAALDALAERDLYQKYAELSEGKTTIYISHRLASTQFCDRIFVMDKGEIVEAGTHEELMTSGGLYSEMFEKQSSYYKTEEQK